MDGPLAGPERAKTIGREISTFADAHSGVSEEEQGITGQIIAPTQFLLDQLILLRSQRARQTVFLAWNIVPAEQMGQSRELLSPSQLFQHATEVDHIDGACLVSQWRV